MARRQQKPDVVEELNSRLDELAHWVVRNRVRVLGGLGISLLGVGFYALYDSVATRQELEASAELARLEAGYRQAMGSEPDAAIVEEPANPELAEQARREFGESFSELAREHPGTPAAVVAHLEAGNRSAELGEPEAAIEAFEAARDAAPGGSALRALALVRLAGALEQQGRFGEAGEALEEAGSVEAFPLRYQALGDAARNFANAGDEGRAVALYRRIELEAPDVLLPEHVRSRLEELQVRVSSGP